MQFDFLMTFDKNDITNLINIEDLDSYLVKEANRKIEEQSYNKPAINSRIS